MTLPLLTIMVHSHQPATIPYFHTNHRGWKPFVWIYWCIRCFIARLTVGLFYQGTGFLLFACCWAKAVPVFVACLLFVIGFELVIVVGGFLFGGSCFGVVRLFGEVPARGPGWQYKKRPGWQYKKRPGWQYKVGIPAYKHLCHPRMLLSGDLLNRLFEQRHTV